MGEKNKGHAARQGLVPSHTQSGGSACVGPDLGLHHAVAMGDIGSIYYALMSGQTVDSVVHGLQAIHVAASRDDVAIIEMLLQSGADVNARSHLVQSARRDQAEERAAKSRGGRVRAKEGTLSRRISGPTNCTAGLYSMEAANSLANDEARGRGRDDADGASSEYGGATPLHYAVANGRAGCVGALMSHGARVDISDSFGNTPQAIAAARGDSIIAAMLEQRREGSVGGLPSPDQSVERLGRGPTGAAQRGRVPARRHTAGEVEAGARYAYVAAPSCEHRRLKAKHRGTSPIGLRALSPSTWLSNRPGRSASASGWLVGCREDDGVARHTADDVQGRRPRFGAAAGEDARRERSYTDSAAEKVWRSFLECDGGSSDAAHDFCGCADDGAVRPVPEPWMWRQAAIAVRNRRTQSLSAQGQQQQAAPTQARRKRPDRLL
ncbi:hypothetical protein GGI04_004073 [Coemansia thaxteri]|uniref:Uncharacterized protein n=1 Tax=Coemansia thaxteri TaxID=2663907 RepID=A0A9W8BFP9_9FUNG|nr:hypothetical protein H4R26_005137 [Coemansia thaxteri]KAJ2000633.1 hypothetical protein GGI04_004073 [Coemansia thaxteri]